MKMRKMLQYRLADLDSMLVLLFAFLQPISAQKADDNVHILQCNDRYVFKTDDAGKTIVVNTTDYVYGVTQYSALVQPCAYYGEFIRLDKALRKRSLHQNMEECRNFWGNYRWNNMEK